jgi:putative selenate reductase molybdopterin-binding subunit
MKLRELLVQAGHVCVRDSDDSEGFCGSDTILMDGKPVYSNLCIAAEADGSEIVTPDALGASVPHG